MAAEAYPTDILGMPLPLVIPRPPRKPTDAWNHHHAWYYARRFLHNSVASEIVRLSRVQYVPKNLHQRVHNRYKQGLEPPADDFTAFTFAVLGCASYVPDEGLWVSRNSVERIELSSAQKGRLRRPGIFGHQKGAKVPGRIAKFMLDFAVANGLGEVLAGEESRIERFLAMPAGSAKQREALGIVATATEVVTGPIEPLYTLAREEESLGMHAPRSPRRLIMGRIKHNIADVSGRLQQNIESQIAA